MVAYERVEVITSVERRRRWSAQEKLRLVAESYRAEGGVGVVADRRGAPSFVPLAIDDVAAVSTPALGSAMAGPSHGAVRGLVEIDLPNGCRVRVEQDIPMAALRRIIGALVRQ